jgi:hypothetical protein
VVVDAVDAAGLGAAAVEGAVVAGFCEQPPATNTTAHKINRTFFIDPPDWGFVLEINLTIIKLATRILEELQGKSPQLILKSGATLT